VNAEAAQRLERARHYVELGRWQDAQSELGLVLASEPQSVEALCLLGQSQLHLDQRAAARRTAEAALRCAPDDEWAHRIHSVALGQLGRHLDAIAAAEEAVRLAPHTADTHQRLANALLLVPGRADEARAAAERAVALAPHAPAAHVAVGLAAGRQGRAREEREAYLRALQLDPTYSTALSNLAALDADRGRLAGASRYVTAALRHDPHHRWALANLDLVATRLVRRLTVVMVLGGLVTSFLASAERDGAPGGWWMRALAGTAALATCAAVGWSTVRHLPAGARLHLRGLPRRLSGYDRLVAVAFLVAAVSMLGTAYLPDDVAVAGAVGVMVVLRLGWVAAIVGLVRWVRAVSAR
jgi:tetratricopeptide (TPR) repeat protein